MAELDYAFIAEFAKVESGKITAVGASYTEISARAFPTQHHFSCAGRVRMSTDEEPADLQVTIVAPDDAYKISAHGVVGNEEAVVYDGKIAGVFAFSNTIPLPGPGLYEVFVDLNGERVRRLAFEVGLATE